MACCKTRLGLGGSFPGSHAFYRTRDNVDQDIFILKPKQQPVEQTSKRKATETPPAPSPKQRRWQAYVRDGSEELSERGSVAPRGVLSPAYSSRGVPQTSTEGGACKATRHGAPSMTPLPPGGVKYRY